MIKKYKDCLFNNKIILKSRQRFKSDHHNVYTEQINMIALSSNDDNYNIRMEQTHSKYTKVSFKETAKYE